MELVKRAEELEQDAIELRRWFHRHPEFSGQAYETTEHIYSHISGKPRNIGIEVHRYKGRTGCWDMIYGGKAAA